MSDGRQRRVLVVDNNPHFRRAMQMLLNARGYSVFAAGNPAEAKALAASERVHVAVLDIRLEDDKDDDDMSGLVLAVHLDSIIVKIILSAYPSVEAVRRSYGDVLAFTFVEKEELPEKLFEELAKAFTEEVQINFDLSIRWRGINPAEVARQIEMKHKPGLAVLAAEIEEALCKLFYQTDEILVTRLFPGEAEPSISQSGAVLLKAQPRYPESGWGAPMVVKLATRDKIAVEAVNYERSVDGFIGGFRHTRIHRRVETHLLAGLIYTLVGTPLDACVDLGTFYAEHPPAQIIEVLNRLFLETCQIWYANRKPRGTRDMMDLYARPLRLSAEGLETALTEAGLSGWLAGEGAYQPLPGLGRRFLNPIHWLRRHPHLPAPASLCFTHGDLHSRNVLVDHDHRTWLIDFYRTGLGHLFRDLIELESDVKFTLLPVSDLPSLLEFETALLSGKHFQDAAPAPRFRQPELDKAFGVVQAIRRIAGGLAEPGADMLDYYQGSLLQTLAMIRLRHVPPAKKQHAYLAAALLCERLEAW